MDKRVYWLWLTTLPNMTSNKITNLLSVFETAKDIYDAKDYSGIYGINQNDIDILLNKKMDRVKTVIERLKLLKAGALTYDDVHYPDMLRQIDEPPYVLYIKGEVMPWDRLLTVAVVGTRKYTDYGIRACDSICRGLAENGVTIVSGMARGLDSVAAKAALCGGGKTIAVLGCGLDIVYPPENGELMNAIMHNGTVITEYPPGTPPVGKHFPYRNRIISGLARGTLVVQAPLKSGALITANYALDSGKDVFAVPGSINDICARGTNSLIKVGAKLVENAQDILDEYDFEIKHLKRPTENNAEYENLKTADSDKTTVNATDKKPENTQNTAVNNVITVTIDDEKYKNLNDEEKKVIELLIKGAMHIDELARQSELAISKLNPTLTILEMKGLVTQMPGKNFRLNLQNHL